MDYWKKRMLAAQKEYSDKSIDSINEQLKKYYKKAMTSTINDFEAVYDKVLNTVEEGKPVTTADLYKLDKYYQMQAQLNKRLQKLGDKQCNIMSKEFEAEYNHIYNALSIDKNETAIQAMISDAAFAQIDEKAAEKVAQEIWCSDGKSWSDRVWDNVNDLQQTLNDNLIDCIVAGKKSTELKKSLMDRFSVSYHRAETLTRTEIAHIETQAAAQRYKDYGLTKYEFLGRDEHDIGCDCKKLNGKVFYYSEMKTGVNAPPMHPNCRCCIIPVVDKENKENMFDLSKQDKEKLNKINEFYPNAVKNKRGELEDEIREKISLSQTQKNKIDLKYYYPDTPRNREKAKQIQLHNRYEDQLRERLKQIQKEAESLVIDDFTFCADCGKPIKLNGRNTNAVKRCPECQAKYRKKYKAQKEKERRAKKKKTK